MRDLQTDDLFLLIDVVEEFGVDDIIAALGKIDVNKYKTTQEDGEEKVDEQAFGAEIVKELGALLLKNLGKCKVSLYKLLAELKGTTTDEIGKQKPAQTVKDVKELLTKEDFRDLFTAAFESLK